MLQAIRGQIGSWVVKILFAFLVIAFAAWGVGDIFRDQGPEQVIATVGDIEIAGLDLERAYDERVEQIRQIAGGRFEITPEMRAGLLDAILTEQVDLALVTQASNDLGLVLSNAAVGAMTRADPLFRDPLTGAFSEARFVQYLGQTRQTEGQYAAALRNRIQRQLMSAAAQSSVTPPQVLVDTIADHRRERRAADLIIVDGDALDDVPEPTAGDLEQFHADNGDAFLAPEYRTLTVLMLAADDIAEEIAVDEAEVALLYEDRINDFTHAERRRFEQALFPGEAAEAVAEFVERVRGGMPFQEAVDASGIDGVIVDEMDWTTQGQMILAELGDAGFALDDGAVSDPVETAFGFHVLRVTAIEPAGTTPLTEVRDELVRELRFDQALDGLFELGNAVDDALAGGATLEEAAGEVGARLISVPAISADGEVRDGDTVPEIPALTEILEEAWDAEPGAVGSIETNDDGDIAFVLRVDTIIDPAVRPLADVRDAVIERWIADQRALVAAEIAGDVAQALETGAEPGTAADEVRAASADETPALLRDGSNRGDLPRALVDRLFEVEPGDVVTAEQGVSVFVARLREIEPAPAEEDAVAAIAASLANDIASDLASQYIAALGQTYAVDRDESALERLIGAY